MLKTKNSPQGGKTMHARSAGIYCFLLLFCFFPLRALAAKYETLVEQGRFYLEKGASYGKEAARVLEEAESSNPQRAAEDAEFLGSLAKAYFLTARYSEAFWVLERAEALHKLRPEDQALKRKLLNESGLGRLKLFSVAALEEVHCELAVGKEQRLDLTAKNVLSVLNELIVGPFSTDSEGLTILVPEGAYALSCSGASLWPETEPLKVEVWSGEETSARLTASYPKENLWRIIPGSRSISLSWPPIKEFEYRLFRILGASEELIYEGRDSKYLDSGLSVGLSVQYRLESLDAGNLIAVAQIKADTMPAVKNVELKASMNHDFTVKIEWFLGSGAADRLRVFRKGREKDYSLFDGDAAGLEIRRAVDGPFAPQKEPTVFEYVIEAFLEGSHKPTASAVARVELPPLVERIIGVSESIDRGAIVLMWETLPREGVADGYAIFRQAEEGVEGVLVGRVNDPFAREFEYQVEDPLAASDWRHMVVPYVGERYVLDPEWLTASGKVPEEDFKGRQRGKLETLPNLGLSWDPAAGARKYEIVVGGKSILVAKPYVEIKGLQSSLMETNAQGEVFGINAAGEKIKILTFDLQYEYYSRSKAKGIEE